MKIERDEAMRLLKTSRGQVDGIIKMINEDRYCVDISKQILAVLALLKKANLKILEGHIKGCVKDAILNENSEEKVDEVMNLLGKYMK